MATCIKTGAWVKFEDYGWSSAADLFLTDDQRFVIIQWNSDGRFYDPPPRTVTHRVQVGRHYHHESRGITVVPRSCVVSVI